MKTIKASKEWTKGLIAGIGLTLTHTTPPIDNPIKGEVYVPLPHIAEIYKRISGKKFKLGNRKDWHYIYYKE